MIIYCFLIHQGFLTEIGGNGRMNPCPVLCTFYLAYRALNSFYTLQGKSKLLAIRGKLEMTNWQEELYDPLEGKAELLRCTGKTMCIRYH